MDRDMDTDSGVAVPREATPGKDLVRLTRRTALQLFTAGAGALLLAACGGSAAPASGSAAASTSTAPAASSSAAATSSTAPAASTASSAAASGSLTPKPGGSIVTGQVGDLLTTDGAYYSPVSNNTIGQVCDELIDYDDNLKVIPRLAESWDLSADNKTIKLNLRKGVTFHNSNREFTSADVKYNILRVRDPKNPYTYAPRIGSAWWDTIDTPDKYTVVLTSSQSRPGVFDFLQYLRIVDKDVMEGPNAKTQLGGTGPYKMMEWIPGDHITFAKNTNYWEKGIPYIDNFRVNIFRDQQSMVSALEAGTIEVADLIAIPDAARLKTNPKYTVYENHSIGQFFYVAANASAAPTDNKMLRQAINYAINRQRFADTVLKGFAGGPINLPWAPSSPAFDAAKNKTYTYDLAKAKSLVQASGLKNIEFDIAWATAGYAAEYQSLAQILQADLQTIGIKTNLTPLDPPTFQAAGTVTPASPKPKYKGLRISAGAFAQLYEAASEFVISPTYGYNVNASGYYDPNFKKLAVEASGEPDAAKRKVLYGQINDLLLDASYAMPLTAYTNIVGMASTVHGLTYEIQTDWTIRDTWLA
ncbi:MAG: ABC transporter substrate-binding protein [Chloroflexota bacterium]